MTHPSYAGIGSRATPQWCLDQMTNLGDYLQTEGYILRSGGADGADSAFERGCYRNHSRFSKLQWWGATKEIYLPWRGFNGHTSSRFNPSPEAMEVAAKFHPNWAACSRVARLFHARNSHQILGEHLDDPVSFVICWTPGGEITGGTGQALRIAQAYNIPIINLGA